MPQSRSHRALLAVALTVALTTLAACASPPPAPRNLLVIVIDTLRADRLAAYGGSGRTPVLDALAARSSVFRKAYAQSSWTNPSVASLFTSRYQSQHRVTSFASPLNADEVTLAEVLGQRGYATGAFLGNFMLRGNLGFEQGFDKYATYHREGSGAEQLIKARADQINSEALQWLDAVHTAEPNKPVFLYLHYMEPHNPYDPPDAQLERVLGGRPRPDIDEVNAAMRLAYMYPFTPEFVRSIQDLYDAEIASLDEEIGRLLAELERRGFLQDAVVVVTADHGEEFLEHEFVGHHKSLYEPAIRIPLLVHVPGQTGGALIDSFAELVDIGPTLLELIGTAAPPSFVGNSLRPYLAADTGWSLAALRRRFSGGPPPRHAAFSELIKEPDAPRKLPHERAVIVDATKLLISDQGTRSFYDLAADPGEKNPQGLDESRRAALAAALADLRAIAARPIGDRPAAVLDADTKERMRALGYAE